MPRERLTNKEKRVLTERTDVKSLEFKEFQALLLNKSREKSETRRVMIELMAQKFKIEDYLKSDKGAIINVGYFLNEYLKTFEIRQNKFADYLDVPPSNFNRLIKGGSLSHELAFKMGRVFHINPMLLLDIQDKNKLAEIKEAKMNEIKNYSIQDLLNQS